MEAPLVPRVLLRHGQFVRALAKSLLRDSHAAEDVAQETWARYLERGPAEERGLRPWLRVVARNVAANLGRGERRRAARDRAAARPEALPPAEEELEHAELLGVVVEAVLALEEPYRKTIVARYYRGLDATAIAAQSGTTAATVRSREHRALENLRERLDRRFHGERGAWAAVLARIAGPPAPELALAPASGWPLGLMATIPVLAVAAGAAFWLRSRSPAVVSPAGPVARVAPSELGAPAALEPAVPVPVAAGAGQRTPLGRDPAGRESAASASLAEIHGRFVFPGGAPSTGVTIRIRGWGANQERILLHGEPGDWVDPQDETDNDGRFALRFEPPRAFQFMLDAKAPGHAEASWRWGEILPGARRDLGEIELPVGGTIVGRIVDSQGKALVGEEWRVYARTVGLGEGDGRDESQVTAAAGGASFRLENVWPGQVELRAHSNIANWIDGPTVAVRSGETSSADIVYSGPSNARRITVVTFCEPFYTHSNPALEHLRLVGPSGETRTARRIDGSSQSHSFDDLASGTYTVEIDDPSYLPWSRAGVRPGERVNAHLVGSAALRPRVIDAAGQPVERYSVRVTLRSSTTRPNEFEVHDGSRALRDGLLGAMLPGDYTVAIRCANGTTARCEVEGLASGETRAVCIEIGSQRYVAGRVVNPDGEGIPGAVVLLLTPAQQDDSDASPILGPNFTTDEDHLFRRELASVESGEDGAFRVDVTRPGPFLLRARADGSQTFSALFTLERARDSFELVLPRPGAVRGRVHAPAGASFESLALWIVPSNLWFFEASPGPLGPHRMQDDRESLEHGLAPLGADGSFELRRLPSGHSRVFLGIAEAVRHGFTLSEGGISGTQWLDELEVPEDGVLERDFTVLELPGWIAFELRVNGQPAPNLEVTLRGAIQVEGRTDASGRFGPKRVPSGAWSVLARDRKAGWDGRLPTKILVESGQGASAILDAQVIWAALTCVDAAGRQIAGETVSLLHYDEAQPGKIRSQSQIETRKTDANGRLELQLMPGEYALQRGNYKSAREEDAPPIVPLTWTTSGPLMERVQL